MLASGRLSSLAAVGVVVGCLSAGGLLPAQAIRVGPDTPVSIGVPDRPLVEPMLAVHPANPRHLLGVAMVHDTTVSYRVPGSPQKVRCASFVSVDAGAAWTRHDFAIRECFDPWVAITPDGHAVFVATGTVPELPHQGGNGLVAYHSADGGRTWDAHPMGLGRSADHPTIVVDGSSPRRRNWLYVVSSHETRVDTNVLRSAVVVTRSRTGGRTFDLPAYIRPNNLRRNAQTPVVLSDASVVVSFVEHNRADNRRLLRQRAWVARSVDGGDRFSDPMFVGEACGSPDFGFAQSYLVADTSGGPFRDRLYYVCNQPATRDVLLAHSADKGESWSDARRVHSAPRDTVVAREVRAAAVNRNGVVGVAWIESQRKPGGECTDLYFAASLDGGETFLPEARVNGAAACETVDNRQARSDYFGMVTDDRGRFRLLWSDARGGLFSLRTAAIEVDGKVARPAR